MAPPVALYDDKGYVSSIISDEEFEKSGLEGQYKSVSEELGSKTLRKLLNGEKVHVNELETEQK